MRAAVLLILPQLLLAADRPNAQLMFDSHRNATQRASVCFQLRGAQDPETLTAMRRAMEDSELVACAADNLRRAGAAESLLDALASSNEQARAAAARNLGSFQKAEFLEPLIRAAQDENLLVATNALAGLSQYRDPAVTPYLAALARKGGMTGDVAIDRLAEIDGAAALKVARQLLSSEQVPDRLYAMRVIGKFGGPSDIPALREIAGSTKENLVQRNRGFGFMPPISLARAATTAIHSIEQRANSH